MAENEPNPGSGEHRNLRSRLRETVATNWHLGFTAFGGPPVHFKIFYDKFVNKDQWINEAMYQELFSISQSLSGPASTKMLYCINLLRNGTAAAVLTFLMWSLPGAVGMFALSAGVSTISSTLPRAAYAVLSGLSAATVGVIAQAAVELSEKAMTDNCTRIALFFVATAGLLYNALWYFPVLIVTAGTMTFLHDNRLVRKQSQRLVRLVGRNGRGGAQTSVDLEESGVQVEDQLRIIPVERRIDMSWKAGLVVVSSFLASFTIVMVLRASLPNKGVLFSFFANIYLAGTIIFGGGPVVIPLLREYVVTEGWISPRDFIIGLAIIQAFPGPNFNFAVYLGGLTASGAGYPGIVGAILGYVAIFTPGLWLGHGAMGLWSAVRSKVWVKSILRGLNAGGVGLIYTAVYRLWQIGYIDHGYQSGTSLAVEPFFVTITAFAFCGGVWFKIQPPVVIVLGAIGGLIWYGVVST